MRDPKRIPVVLKLLEQYWTKSPDLRLCQIIGNIFGNGDHYYREDDLVIAGLQYLIQEDDDYESTPDK